MDHVPPPGLALPGIVLGIGLGGMADGIVLHQLLQWHHMLSSTDSDHVGMAYHPMDTVQGLRTNTLWDGVFHALTWLVVLLGIGLLHGRMARAGGRVPGARALWGWVLVGWGAFNLVEGVVDHQVLGLHHVRSGPDQLWWDLGYLAVGAVLVATGWLLQRATTVRDVGDR